MDVRKVRLLFDVDGKECKTSMNIDMDTCKDGLTIDLRELQHDIRKGRSSKEPSEASRIVLAR